MRCLPTSQQPKVLSHFLPLVTQCIYSKDTRAGSDSQVQQQTPGRSQVAPHYMCLTHQSHQRGSQDISGLLKSSEEICLLHDAEELFFIHFAISVTISFIDHLLEFLICHTLTQLFRDTLQVLETDLPSLLKSDPLLVTEVATEHHL